MGSTFMVILTVIHTFYDELSQFVYRNLLMIPLFVKSRKLLLRLSLLKNKTFVKFCALF